MRLTKDVKVEICVDIDLVVGEKFKWPATIKTYKRKPTVIVEIKKPRLFDLNYKERLRRSGIDAILNTAIKSDDVIIVDNIEEFKSMNSYTTETAETSDTEAIVEVGYVSKMSYRLVLNAYGKITIGRSRQFENCFETRSGLTIDDIVSADKIEKVLNTWGESQNMTFKVSSIEFDDEVKLLMNDEEFSDAICASSDEIMRIVDDNIGRIIHGNSEEE